MARTKTTLKKGDKLPPRGKSAKTLILDSIREEALLGLDEDATKEELERAVFKFMAKAAFNPTYDISAEISSACLTALADRGWSKLKRSDVSLLNEIYERLNELEKGLASAQNTIRAMRHFRKR